jgi:hypothetical protein
MRMSEVVAASGERGGAHSAGARQMLAERTGAQPQENVPLVLFLASSASDHITGQYMEANNLPERTLIAARDESQRS